MAVRYLALLFSIVLLAGCGRSGQREAVVAPVEHPQHTARVMPTDAVPPTAGQPVETEEEKAERFVREAIAEQAKEKGIKVDPAKPVCRKCGAGCLCPVCKCGLGMCTEECLDAALRVQAAEADRLFHSNAKGKPE